MIHERFTEQRYTNPRYQVPKSDWTLYIFSQYDSNCWRVSPYIDPESFKFILSLIENYPIFSNQSTSP